MESEFSSKLLTLNKDDLEHLALARSSRFQALLERAWQSLRAGKGLSRDDFWKAVERRHQERMERR